MERRKAIQTMALIVGGAVLLPRGLKARSKNEIELANLQLSAEQQETMADVCETIIPKTSIPGAKDLRLHLFVIKMVDDCYSSPDQLAFVSGLGKLDDLSTKLLGLAFSKCSKQQRENLLLAIDKPNDFAPELNTFYRITKDKTVQGYTTSQFFMTTQVIYELVPGRYNAYFPVKA